MLPFLILGLTGFLDAWGDRSWVRALILVLAAWSFFVVWAETIGGQHFPDWTANPLFNYSLPSLARGDIARNVGMVLGLPGWFSLLPLLLGLGAGLWLLVKINLGTSPEMGR